MRISTASCIWQLFVRCWCFLVRQWILVSSSLRRLFSDPLVVSRPALICVCIQRTAWSILEPLFVVSLDEYTFRIVREMTSGIISVSSTLWFDNGYMYCVSLRGFWLFTYFLRDMVDSDLEVDSRLSELLVLSAMLGSTVTFGTLRCRVVVTVSLLMVLTILHGTA